MLYNFGVQAHFEWDSHPHQHPLLSGQPYPYLVILWVCPTSFLGTCFLQPRPKVHTMLGLVHILWLTNGQLDLEPDYEAVFMSLASLVIVLVCEGCHKKELQIRQFKQQSLFPISSRGYDSNIKLSAGLVSSEALSPWFVDSHPHQMFSHGLPQ